MLKLCMENDTCYVYWNLRLRKHVSIPKQFVNDNQVSMIEIETRDLVQLTVLTALSFSMENVFQVIPRSFFQAVIPDDQFQGWLDKFWYHRKMKSFLIKDTTRQAIHSLKKCFLWPPSNAAEDLPHNFWDICFQHEVIEVVFSRWTKGLVDFQAIVTSPASYPPRQWLHHLFVILMELRWKFDTSSKDTRSLTSGTILGAKFVVSSLAQQQHRGVAPQCLCRETWDDVIDNFEHDVLATWDRPPIEFTDLDCYPLVEDNRLPKTSIWKQFSAFATRLRDNPPQNLPSALVNHFTSFPPGHIGQGDLLYVGCQIPRKTRPTADSSLPSSSAANERVKKPEGKTPERQLPQARI
ncbi:hypothetical protein ONS95_013599 [Cadophora gregata]|uniref:uncharacterized protein n=1 Tax=Cadophora gregata TaxID=51156 RepID=UPI0026DC93CF|nr:uncharacterized protein ONS95_013599 [Cadophora gregata]KAK0113345.1 hypothetical protein ONS96_014210 [Cadophora gregata f. sp. sojae]KAK0114094.1 hypothetical protein ONS95_013599 [Cadophora gregata]